MSRFMMSAGIVALASLGLAVGWWLSISVVILLGVFGILVRINEMSTRNADRAQESRIPERAVKRARSKFPPTLPLRRIEARALPHR